MVRKSLSDKLILERHLIHVSEIDSSPEAVHQLVKDMIQEDFLCPLIQNIHNLRFEARKDSQTILSCALRFRPPNSTEEDTPALAYVLDHRPEVVLELCRGYEHRESAMPCGIVLREILKNEHITAIVLHDQSQVGESATLVNDLDLEQTQTGEGIFWRFFDYIDKSAFEASTDAFTTFRELLTKHKSLVSQYLTINFDLFFENYNKVLIGSESYVTKRQSIKLLGEILLDRANYNVMTAYVDKGDHLKLCMVLLKDDRKMVQYEGFHVFKVRPSPFFAKATEALQVQYRQLISPSVPFPCTNTGLRRQPPQVRRGQENPDPEPRSPAKVPPRVFGGPAG